MKTHRSGEEEFWLERSGLRVRVEKFLELALWLSSARAGEASRLLPAWKVRLDDNEGISVPSKWFRSSLLAFVLVDGDSPE